MAWHYETFRATTGGLLTPRTPVAHLAAASSARLRTILTLERAHTRPYTAWRKRQAALRRRVASLISGRLRGTFPLGLPECIRQTALPCVRGPDRAPRLRRGGCWLAALCLGVLQQPHKRFGKDGGKRERTDPVKSFSLFTQSTIPLNNYGSRMASSIAFRNGLKM